LLQIIENGPDDIRIGDIRDDPECPPAARAHGNIDLEDSFEALEGLVQRTSPKYVCRSLLLTP
jgi:hypothetical protein